MNTAWVLTVPPLVEPVSINAAKKNVRGLALSDDDDLLARFISARRAQVEVYLNRGLLTQTWKYTQDVWSDEILLPRAPLQSVSSVKYYDAAGVLQTVASSTYLVDSIAEPGAVRLAPTQVWPVLQSGRPAAIEITYIVGYASVALIPAPIVDAIHLLVAHSYAHPGDEVSSDDAGPLGHPAAEARLAPYRVFWRPPRVDVCR
jgi:uncharacterized phiE125 gp8 family phage protein